MAIEFRCSQCNQLLRVPEEAAGKNARCPKCQALMTVPGVAVAMPFPGETLTPGPAPPPPPKNPFAGEPYVGPMPLPPKPSGDNPFGGATTSPADALNPYASPAAAAYAYAPQYFAMGPRPGLPWEYEQRTLGCWFRTMGIVIGSPSQAFSMMRQYGGLGIPLLYNLYAVGMIFALCSVIALPLMAIVGGFGAWNNAGGEVAAGMAMFAGVMLLGAIFYAVILVVVGPLLSSAIIHVTLMAVGGAKQGFETTFRVMCFGYYSLLLPTMLLNFVPYLGALAATIWIVVILINGLSRAHEISGGKAAAGVLLPMGLCCGFFIVLALFDNSIWR